MVAGSLKLWAQQPHRSEVLVSVLLDRNLNSLVGLN